MDMKTPRKKTLRNKADKRWTQYHIEENPICESCGDPAKQVHHYYYKGSYGHLRYDDDNATSLCTRCHFLLHTQDPKTIEANIIGNRGEEWYERLTKKALARPKAGYQTVQYYKDAIEKYREI